MNPRILAVEVRDELYTLIREPAAMFFTVAMPVGFFALFAGLFGQQPASPGISVATFMLASFGVFGVVGVTLMSPGIGVAEDREHGWLRVKRVSPVPLPTTLLAKVIAALPIAVGVLAAMTAVTIAMGLFDASVTTWLRLIGILLIGSIPFALIGLAVGFTASARAAPAILNAVFIPMSVASGLWLPLNQLPEFVQRIAPYLPTYHLSQIGMNMLAGVSSTGHWLALGITTMIGALAAGLAYRFGRT